MTLDGASSDWLDSVRARCPVPLHELTVAEARALYARLVSAHPATRLAEISELRIPSVGGPIPVRIYRPTAPPGGVIVYYHAGGWVLGGLDEADGLADALAQAGGCTVVSVGYRLAPEYRYPTATQDAWTALLWTTGHLAELADASAPLIVAGECAGANLAAVVARRARDRGGPPLALQVLACPLTDADFDATSYVDPANQLLFDRAALRWLWDQYMPAIEARIYPDAAPLQEVSLARLPPALVLTAEHDVVRDEGEVYAMRLVQGGVPVTHRRLGGLAHGFLEFRGMPGSREALSIVAEAIHTAVRRAIPFTELLRSADPQRRSRRRDDA